MKEKLIARLIHFYSFNLEEIEREAKIPKTTLNNVLKGRRDLPDKYVKPLEKVMKKRKML